MNRCLCLLIFACTPESSGKRVLACELLDNGDSTTAPLARAEIAKDGSYELNLGRPFSSRTILQISSGTTCARIGTEGTVSAPAISATVDINVASELIARRLLAHTDALDAFSNAELAAVLAFAADATFPDATVADVEARIGTTVSEALAGFRGQDIAVADGTYNALALIAGGGKNLRFEVASGTAVLGAGTLTFAGALQSRELVEECAPDSCGHIVGAAKLTGTFAPEGTFSAFAGGQTFVAMPDGVTRGAVSRDGRRIAFPLALEDGADAIAVLLPQVTNAPPSGRWAYRQWHVDLGIAGGQPWEPILWRTGVGLFDWSSSGIATSGRETRGSQLLQCGPDALVACATLTRYTRNTVHGTTDGVPTSLSPTGTVTIGRSEGTLAGITDGSLLVAPTSNDVDTLFAVRIGTPAALTNATFNVVSIGGVLDDTGDSTEIKSGVLRFSSDGTATYSGHVQRNLRTTVCGSCATQFAPTIHTFTHALRFVRTEDGELTLEGDEAKFTGHLSHDGETLVLSRVESGPGAVVHAVGVGFLRDP